MMLELFNLTLPIFAVVGLGYLAARINMVKPDAIGAINTFVFYFAMPALVAGALGRQEFSKVLDLPLLAGWLVAGLLLFAVGMVFCRVYQSLKGARASLGEMALTGQAASIANVGFLALPIVAANFGDEGVRISASILIVDLLIIIPLSITLLEAQSGGSGVQAFIKAIGKAVRNPFAIAILLGVGLSLSGIGLPGPLTGLPDFWARRRHRRPCLPSGFRSRTKRLRAIMPMWAGFPCSNWPFTPWPFTWHYRSWDCQPLQLLLARWLPPVRWPRMSL